MSVEYITVASPPPASIVINQPVVYEKTYIGPENPNFTSPGIWIQTGLGSNGEGLTIWFEDGQ